MSSTGDFEKIRRRAEEQGFRYEEKTNGHIQFFAPDGKTIVTCSINNWDQSFHSKQNFLSDLKRAGYVHEEEGNGILRDALTNALTAPVERKKPTTELVLEFLQRRADRNIHSSDIRMYVRSKRPDLHETSVYSALKFLKDKGKVLAFSGSYYRHRPESEIAPVSVPLLATVREAPTPPPLPASEMPPLGATTGDAQIDADLRLIDDALVALARIEEVVRRNRAVLMKAAELKKLLGGLGT